MNNNSITVTTKVKGTINKVWDCWTNPEHIIHWNFASDDWHCPQAKNDLRVDGKFSYTMAAKDGSMSFDLEGTYLSVVTHEKIELKLADERKVTVTFNKTADQIEIAESFEAENIHSHEQQQFGWQCILDNFKKYTESI
jgi:uncharacterized protein YndB with AHSA1/START domain